MSKGYVYLIKEADGDFYKIGHTTKNPETRLKELQTGNPRLLKLIATYQTDNYKHLERLLHETYKKNHYSGEWFIMSLEIEDQFLIECKAKNNTALFLREQKAEDEEQNRLLRGRI